MKKRKDIAAQKIKDEEYLRLMIMQLEALARTWNFMAGHIWGDAGENGHIFHAYAIPSHFDPAVEFGMRGWGASIFRCEPTTRIPEKLGLPTFVICQARTQTISRRIADRMGGTSGTVHRFLDSLESAEAKSLYQLELLAGVSQ